MAFPNVAEAMWDWDTAITFHIVKKQITDFEVVDQTLTDTMFFGVIQPLPKQRLLIKPEGERKWKWLTLWTTQNLNVDMIIESEGVEYRVASSSNWNAAGYHEYELVQGVPGE